MKPTFTFSLRPGLEDRYLPAKGTEYALGYDVRAALTEETMIVRAGHYFRIPLGFRYLPEEGWGFELHPRSSSFAKKNMHCLIGIVDEDWEGETIFVGQFIPDSGSISSDLVIRRGDAVGQLLPVRRVELNKVLVSSREMDELYAKRKYRRGANGIGSTG